MRNRWCQMYVRPSVQKSWRTMAFSRVSTGDSVTLHLVRWNTSLHLSHCWQTRPSFEAGHLGVRSTWGRKHPPIPLPYSLNKAGLKKKMSGVRLIPDSSNSLSLCWLLFAPLGPFCLFRYPALSRQDWLPTALFELPCPPDSYWVSLLEDIYKVTVRKRWVHQNERSQLPPWLHQRWSYPLIGWTTCFYFPRTIPVLVLKVPPPQSQANQDSYSQYPLAFSKFPAVAGFR